LRATQLSIWSTSIWRLITPRRYFFERFSTRMTGGTFFKGIGNSEMVNAKFGEEGSGGIFEKAEMRKWGMKKVASGG
jgi:hypothetical protein